MASIRSDLDIERIRVELSGRLIGGEVRYFPSVDSTMDEARRLAANGVVEGTVIVADEQQLGRGRFDRRWTSPAGKDLLLSVVLRTGADQLPYVNMAATLAVLRTTAGLTNQEPTIKWPNDVRVKGKKIAGILVESDVDEDGRRYSIVGVGLNVNLDPSSHAVIRAVATSLQKETGHGHDRTKVFLRLMRHFDSLYADVKRGHSLRAEWATHLETLGREVVVWWKDRTLKGTAEDVDEQGNLILRQPNGTTIMVASGEVTLQSG